MRRLSHTLFATAGTILLLAAPAAGQGDRGGAAGGFGGGGSSLGQSGLGQSSFGQSGLGQSGFGQSALGQSGGQGGSLLTGDSAFVGRGAADMQAFFGGLNEAFGGGSRSRSARDRGEANPSGVRRPQVRVQIKLDPDLRRAAERLSTGSLDSAIANLDRLLYRRGLDGVELTTDNATVRLTGSVESESDRLLAEKIASIEPGVRRIENELRVLPRIEETLPAPR